MSKICERVALNQLIAYIKNKKRLTEHQSGNKAQHSIETLNVMMTDNYKVSGSGEQDVDTYCSFRSVQST